MTAPLYVFTHSTFKDALKHWKNKQLDAYPNQEEKILITVASMEDFMLSESIKALKMLASGSLDSIEIEKPKMSKSLEKKVLSRNKKGKD